MVHTLDLLLPLFLATIGQCQECFPPFYCPDGTCIDRKYFCDGKADCPGGTDEQIYNASIHEGKGINCRHSRNPEFECFLPSLYLGDHELDCKDGIDESGYNSAFTCGGDQYALKVSFCDGVEHCVNGNDEKEYVRGRGGFQCPVSKRHLTKSCVLPDVHVCDGSSDCLWGIDECFCNDATNNGSQTESFSNEKCFRCLDGTRILPNFYVCDGIIHCPDLSDECLCANRNRSKKITEVCDSVCTDESCRECRGKLRCLPRLRTGKQGNVEICVNTSKICDDKYDCFNGFDEDFCELDDEYFICKDKSTRVRKLETCDGKNDCPDGSDEDNCYEEKYICDLFADRNLTWTHFQKWNDTEKNPPLNRTTVADDWYGFTNTEWPFYQPYYAAKCDGVPTCGYGLDECGTCNNTYGFCDFIENNLDCPNSKSRITGSEVCDGQPTCNDTAPNESEDEKGCPNRFYCTNRGRTRLPIHIPMENRCDGRTECDDQSDELNCSSETHFTCVEGGLPLFVLTDKVCDKRMDCKNGEDECNDCTRDPFSSDENLIESRVLVGFLWIIGSMSTLGNTVVMIHQMVMIYRTRNARNTVALKNRVLLLNLSCADLLMGIYLIFLGIKDATIDRYCVQDQEWRSSSTCSALGSIAVVGTEASVLILLIMTTHRLHLVFRPFKEQKMSSIIIPLIFAWGIAILLATFPLSPSVRDYFLSCVWFPTHPYLGYVCKDDLTEFTQKLIAFEGPDKLFSTAVGSDVSWNSIFAAQKVLNSSYEPERFYGYYSANGVCLPRFFPNPKNDASWGYTLFLVLINFFAFLFILISYLFIYRRSVSSRVSSRSEDRATVLQRKVTRIVLTDFCCWMPICIMAFITVAGVDVGDVAYAVTAIILLPINSAMNPFLYSSLLDVIWEHLEPVRNRVNETQLGQSVQASFHKIQRHKRDRDSMATSVTNISPESNGGESASDRSPGPKGSNEKEGDEGIELSTVAEGM